MIQLIVTVLTKCTMLCALVHNTKYYMVIITKPQCFAGLEFILTTTYNMHVSYFFSEPSIIERMVIYNLHYLFPVGFACVYVSFKAPTFLYCIVSVYYIMKITENSFVHP